MKTIIFFLFAGGLALPLCAQIQLDFNTGNLRNWQGDTAKFALLNGQLQLNDANPAASNTAILALPAPTSRDTLTRWEMLVKLDFSPSNTNFARIYLSSSTANFAQSTNGYFLQIGGITGNDDALQLLRQDGSATTVLINGRTGGVGTATVALRVRVERDTSGRWTLAADYTGGTAFELEGSATDRTFANGAFCGVWCRYSATRNRAFAFDDLLVNPLFRDRTPPRLLSAAALTATTVVARFDEAMEAGSANSPQNYVVAPAIGAPASAQLDPNDPTLVTLTLATPLANLGNYTLTASNLRDLAGNAAGPLSASFSYLDLQPALPGDLAITEIMADPTPQIGTIPPVEYLEIFNRSTKAIRTEDLRLSKGSTPVAFPRGVLLPNSYTILCGADEASSFQSLGSTLGLVGFPALTNAGDRVVLSNAAGQTLVDLRYSSDWYRGSTKADGGWSLEIANPASDPNCAGNWQPSINPNGGTPGQVNSVNGQQGDNLGPTLVSAIATQNNLLRLIFDEQLDLNNAEDERRYTLSNGLSVISALLQADAREVVLQITPLTIGQVVELTVTPGMRDCLGNPQALPQITQVGLPEMAQAGDVLINEVLFNPFSGGSDFVELTNNSNKLISLQGLKLLNRQKTSGTIETTFTVPFLLLPGEFVALANSREDVLGRYFAENPSRVLTQALPTLEAEEGNLTLQLAGVTLDSFNYSDDLHHPLLASDRGVALERLSNTLPTNSPGNWHSAATTKGGATPGYRNSQFFPVDLPSQSTFFELPEKVLSPDGDGFQDVLLLPYRTDQPDYLANIRIFDAQGRLTRVLTQNEALGNSGALKWDGATDDNQRARLGVYVIWIELFQPGGTKKVEKLTCVVAGRL